MSYAAASVAASTSRRRHERASCDCAALDLAYNLDHDQALELLRRAVALAA